jgi:hypothetical protein
MTRSSRALPSRCSASSCHPRATTIRAGTGSHSPSALRCGSLTVLYALIAGRRISYGVRRLNRRSEGCSRCSAMSPARDAAVPSRMPGQRRLLAGGSVSSAVGGDSRVLRQSPTWQRPEQRRARYSRWRRSDINSQPVEGR